MNFTDESTRFLMISFNFLGNQTTGDPIVVLSEKNNEAIKLENKANRGLSS